MLDSAFAASVSSLQIMTQKTAVRVLAVLIIFLSIFLSGLTTSKLLPAKSLSHFNDHAKAAPINLANSQTYQGLPVGEVKTYQTANAWGSAVFIPQYHKNPGSNPFDKQNDSAAVAQEQIYTILSFLTEKAGLNLVVVEGELAGEVPAEKIAALAQKSEAYKLCVSLLNSLKNELAKNSLDSRAEQQLFQKLDKELASAQREMILEGAPIKLSADGKKITLRGSEDSQTREQAKVLVRDYIYLQDRLGELQNPSQKNQVATRPLNSSYDQLLSLLLSGKDKDSTTEQFTELEEKAAGKGKEQLKNLLSQTRRAFSALGGSAAEQSGAINLGLLSQTGGQAPSREDNPYQNITSVTQLKKLLSQSEAKIDEVVVKRRNTETAQNFAEALKMEKVNTGILQFGAGHEEGLIAELQKQGLSVIVIKPQEVVKRNSQTL